MLEVIRSSHDQQQLISRVLRDLSTSSTVRESYEDAAGFAQLGFDILKTTLGVFWKGDIRYTGPTSQIGVLMPSKPDLDYTSVPQTRRIINYRTKTPVGIEAVNVKFRCKIQYNGPEVLASFGFAAGGKRARLGSDAEIIVGNPLSLKTIPTSEDWQRIGIKRYPVIKIPIEFRVDEPWPNDNYEETFTLVLSGMQGFGAPGLKPIINRNAVKT
jgi:hypothetical protein